MGVEAAEAAGLGAGPALEEMNLALRDRLEVVERGRRLESMGRSGLRVRPVTWSVAEIRLLVPCWVKGREETEAVEHPPPPPPPHLLLPAAAAAV